MADLERFVSTSGKDGPGRGTAAKPFRTIQKAAADLKGSMAAGDTGKILVEPGLYDEVVVLTDNMQLLRKDGAEQVALDIDKESISELQPAVRIRRPPSASAPGASSSSPTWSEVLKIHGKNVVLTGLRVEGAEQPQRALFVHDSQGVTITGCVITGGRTRIIYRGLGTGTKADPFHSAVAEEGEGAGMRILRSKNVTIRNCAFIDNRTELKFEQAVKDVEIDKIKSSKTFKGAAALGIIDAVAAEKKLRQAQPVRTGGGHLSCFDSDQISVQNCLFSEGFAGGRGGAVQLAHNAYASFNKCLFRNNESGVDGGAFAFSDPDPNFFSRKPISLTNCKFKDNKGGDDAGAAYFTTAAQATLKNCRFERNQCNGNGGAVRITFGANVKMENCDMLENRANIDFTSRVEKNQDGGGAIAVQDASLEMIGGNILSNKVGGFAGGGIYFLTAAYDEKAEILADLTHGTTFEKILKQGYKVTSVQLKLTKVSFASNEASGETCYQDACSLSPRNGFKAGGAGGAIYALESLKDFGLPVTVTLDGVAAIENLSTHNEDKQKADLVFRNLTKLIVKNDNLAKHPSNKFVMSLMSVHDADLTGSPKFPDRRKQGLVFEEKSNVNP